MAAVTTMKCSTRRTTLLYIRSLIDQLIDINEQADEVRQRMLAVSVGTTDVGATVNKILAAAGPATMTTEATGDTLTDRLVNMLGANATDTTNQVGWEYLAE